MEPAAAASEPIAAHCITPASRAASGLADLPVASHLATRRRLAPGDSVRRADLRSRSRAFGDGRRAGRRASGARAEEVRGLDQTEARDHQSPRRREAARRARSPDPRRGLRCHARVRVLRASLGWIRRGVARALRIRLESHTAARSRRTAVRHGSAAGAKRCGPFGCGGRVRACRVGSAARRVPAADHGDARTPATRSAASSAATGTHTPSPMSCS